MNGPISPAIDPAEITWREGVPESRKFGDVYFNRDNGLEESRYVFVRHNRLAERFALQGEGTSFVIAEAGFGTGLNFLAAWQQWQTSNPSPRARLHFVSAERYPLRREDLRKALSLWPELSELAEQLITHYPPLVHGAHRILLAGGRVRLTLYFGDVLDAWRELEFRADAWFLDGFAPAVNPGIWQDEALAHIRSHSNAGATLATFTSVARVRRALENGDFRMSKVPGFGNKRDMLQGELLAPASRPAGDLPTLNQSVAVIGAGIAGCLLAANLAARGVEVTLIDRAPGPGAAASGNLQGALYVKLGVEFNPQTQLALSALLFSQRYYQPFEGESWHPSGLFQMAHGQQEIERQRRFVQRNHYPSEVFEPVSPAVASRLTGVEVENGGLWFPGSGWLKPAELCLALSEQPGINHLYSAEVQELTRAGGGWRVCAGEHRVTADRVVICGGHQTPTLIPVARQQGHFRFKPIRGQVSHLPETMVHAPVAVICGPRYINPASDGIAVTGATFDLHDASADLSTASHQENVNELDAMLPSIWRNQSADEGEALAGRVGFRCTTHDYQPVAGELANLPGTDLSNLFLLTGFGSKGLTYAPLLAEYLADKLTGEPACLPHALAKRVRADRCFRPVAAEQPIQH